MTETRDTEALIDRMRDRCDGWTDTVATVALAAVLAPSLLAPPERPGRVVHLAETAVFAVLLFAVLAGAAPMLQSWPVAASLGWLLGAGVAVAWFSLLWTALLRSAYQVWR